MQNHYFIYYTSHSMPSCKPKYILNELPSWVLAEHAVMDHCLSLMSSSFRVSLICRGKNKLIPRRGRGRVPGLVYWRIWGGEFRRDLFPAKIKIYKRFTFKRVPSSSPDSASLLLSAESTTKTKASLFSK